VRVSKFRYRVVHSGYKDNLFSTSHKVAIRCKNVRFPWKDLYHLQPTCLIDVHVLKYRIHAPNPTMRGRDRHYLVSIAQVSYRSSSTTDRQRRSGAI
jgi:hypothetical protein